ncbi:hypothetical protein EYF80_050575 [Liparis tanakae]|uniref:Uncharacterized protein n=1 Tax=Liparis tanakae TaxID=230148 RepID=A0A4Z2FEQ9_9TELE|nr:hypothetical protein EYF80_050575 [Liparis tanakae]
MCRGSRRRTLTSTGARGEATPPEVCSGITAKLEPLPCTGIYYVDKNGDLEESVENFFRVPPQPAEPVQDAALLRAAGLGRARRLRVGLGARQGMGLGVREGLGVGVGQGLGVRQVQRLMRSAGRSVEVVLRV